MFPRECACAQVPRQTRSEIVGLETNETKWNESTMYHYLESARSLLLENENIILPKDQCIMYEFKKFNNIGKKLANAMFPNQFPFVRDAWCSG